jgi:nuclear transport factor 2 (NTF2) superfamily protein
MLPLASAPYTGYGCGEREVPIADHIPDVQIAVQFWYEWHDESGQWWRTYGLEDWTFAEDGRMRKRQMSGNDVKLADHERWFTEGVDVNEVSIDEKHW